MAEDLLSVPAEGTDAKDPEGRVPQESEEDGEEAESQEDEDRQGEDPGGRIQPGVSVRIGNKISYL